MPQARKEKQREGEHTFVPPKQMFPAGIGFIILWTPIEICRPDELNHLHLK